MNRYDPRDPFDPNENAETNDSNDPNEQREPYIYAQPKQRGFSLMGDSEPDDDGTMSEADEGEAPTPQEQQQYNDIVTAGLSMIYSNPDNARNIAMKLQEDAQAKGGIANAIGQQAATIMLSVVRGLKKQGAMPDPDVVLNAGAEVLSEVFEIAERTGQVPQDQSEQIMQDAMYEGTRYYGEQEQKAGEITPEMQAQARQAVEADIQRTQGQRSQPMQGA
jgi:hypothetical protein